MRALADAVVAEHGRVDVLVNAAGVMLRKEYDETTLEEFERVVRVNLTGTWLVGREFGPRHGGRRAGPDRQPHHRLRRAGRPGARVRVLRVEGRRRQRHPLARRRARAARASPSTAWRPRVFYPTAMTAPLGEDPDAARSGSPTAPCSAASATPTPTSPAPCSCSPRPRVVVRHRPGALRRRRLVRLVTHPPASRTSPIEGATTTTETQPTTARALLLLDYQVALARRATCAWHAAARRPGRASATCSPRPSGCSPPPAPPAGWSSTCGSPSTRPTGCAPTGSPRFDGLPGEPGAMLAGSPEAEIVARARPARRRAGRRQGLRRPVRRHAAARRARRRGHRARGARRRRHQPRRRVRRPARLRQPACR